ncbi:HD domain-containing protein [Chromobacterium rhizoryzae]|uniref:HD domain-containing protein n=2 Tax=Chromobacterium rhizoryzae TaxID=1778675 RepID=A0AAD0W9W6_9NEIS|nr:HD domain-containing protein [Chromobacterium rhizoryzae]
MGEGMGKQELTLEIVEPEAFHDFMEVMSDYAPQVEHLVCQLGFGDTDAAQIDQLFRLLHSIKGDASMCQVRFVVPFVHSLESLLERLRSGEVSYEDSIGDVMLLVMDRLGLALEALENHELLDDLQLPLLMRALNQVAECPVGELLQRCQQLVEQITGIPLHVIESDTPTDAAAQLSQGDLAFFRILALQFEQRLPQFQGRTERNLELALETSRQAPGLVDDRQMEAAVYMHDIGMMLLPESFWLKVGRMSESERHQMAEHPGWAAGLLERMPAWADAARMVAQHHEMPDGRGYPHGLHGDEICSGALILALVDAFEAVTLKHSHRGLRHSMMRAIAEINASERQFDPFWLARFNQVIRVRLAACARRPPGD